MIVWKVHHLPFHQTTTPWPFFTNDHPGGSSLVGKYELHQAVFIFEFLLSGTTPAFPHRACSLQIRTRLISSLTQWTVHDYYLRLTKEETVAETVSNLCSVTVRWVAVKIQILVVGSRVGLLSYTLMPHIFLHLQANTCYLNLRMQSAFPLLKCISLPYQCV